MCDHHGNQPLHMETTCAFLIAELQKIWDEVGESDNERDKMLFELEQECLDAYRRKVDQASRSQAQLRQTIADSQVEVEYICASLGEQPVHIKQSSGSLKEKLQAIIPRLEELKKKKNERKSQIAEVQKHINSILKELCRSTEENLYNMFIDESDLSLRRLEELKNQLLLLQKEKRERMKQVLDQLNTLNSFCMVLGMDFKLTIHEIHPTLDDACSMKSVSADTIERLSLTISRLKDVKIQRMRRLEDLAITMVELWSLMDIPVEEQQMFQNVTRNIGASENGITEPNTLSLDFINNAEAEVLRLQEMKSIKMKEVLLKKRLVLEGICKCTHMVAEEQCAIDLSTKAIESGETDPTYLLDQMELHIAKVKEEAFSRKEIIEKFQKWLAACEEECWLEDYNRDGNRYNSGRGAHLMLKRAEKARALVNKIPAMLETLTSKAKAWEKERGVKFSYDGVGLLFMVEQYCALKQDKEQERQRQRDQKKLQGQLMAEKEVHFGSKPSPSTSGNKNFRPSTGNVTSKRYTLGVAALQNSYPEKTPLSCSLPKSNSVKQHNLRSHLQSGFYAHSSGKKNVSNVPVKQHSSTESLLIRKPLSPMSSSLSSNIESTKMHTVCKSSVATPTTKFSVFDENKTPKVTPIPMPATPPTVSISTQTDMMPATLCIWGTQDVKYS
ncbi:65-kDa microtubule-associated protein 3 [Abeliophyllum distichum]|uniref:65-kDa microtubule-associated protein 3 n=1 Tax=Abeliophyllum distichum TaxID=126358 RepID=A0ABD1RUF7_9LAMI